MPVTRSQAARWTRIPLAGGGQETLLSEVGPLYLLPLFSTADACALRLVCREFLSAVSEQPWEDRATHIRGSIAAWRACFPRARCANVQGEDRMGVATRAHPLSDADFVHFEGLQELYMAYCEGITDAAFVHLRGIHTLDMTGCDQPAISDAAFENLKGIQRLSTMWNNQATITDAAFAHLRGIKFLNMSSCTQLTDAAFVHLRGIHTLYMWYCNQPAITDAAFEHLRGIHTLVMDCCSQVTITGASFSVLNGSTVLEMRGCSAAAITTAQSMGLPVRTQGGVYGNLSYET